MNVILKVTFISLFSIWLSGFSACSYFSTTQNPKVNNYLSNNSEQKFPALTDNDLEKMSKDDLVLYLRGQARSTGTATTSVDLRNSLSFGVHNSTSTTVFVTCFYWMKNKPEGFWRWDKSKIYEVKTKETKFIVLDEIEDERDRKDIYGYLAVFKKKDDACASVIERVGEDKLLDLDKIYNLKNKIISIDVKNYGFIETRLGYQVLETNSGHQQSKKLDLIVENQSGKDMLICLFVYEQPERTYMFDDWRYEKTNIQLFKAGEIKKINLPPVFDSYRYSYIRGVLGVFDLKDKLIAQNTTFELAPAENKLALGFLAPLKNQKIVIDVENYGIIDPFIDYTIKPASFFNKKTGQWINLSIKR